ncbi:hypothetical protein M9H77_27571 [Catharanthus roseus]|uniref:Uncharacterized protein n=1 Tax=Catharanthus roseus TaxID=4058 RepID=A0ACC0AH73_CATRO|nr:hypothetical protein M9H77_27571 [Catharanthus roseus]
MRQFARAQMVPDAVDTRLDLYRIQLKGNDNTSWVTQHAIHIDTWNQWRVRVRDGPAIVVEALSYPRDEYIKWYRGITQVYIGNPANRDTRAHGYQPAGVDRRMMTSMLQEVDDGASVAIREPPSSPSEMARGDQRHPGRGVSAGRPPAPQRQEHVDPGPAVVEKGEGSGSGQQYVDPFDSSHLDMPFYSLASSSDEEEGQDALGHGHRVGKKTMRFKPSDCNTQQEHNNFARTY